MRAFGALFALVALATAADAMVLSCVPLHPKGVQQLEAYIDGEASENVYPPAKIEQVRALARLGADAYEFFPDQAKQAELRDGALRIHLWQPLSAGASAEIRLEGKLAARKGEAFTMQATMRSEWREGRGDVRCTIE